VQRVIKLKALSKAAGVKAGVYICKAAGAGAGAGVKNCKTAGAGPGAGAEKPEFAQHYSKPYNLFSHVFRLISHMLSNNYVFSQLFPSVICIFKYIKDTNYRKGKEQPLNYTKIQLFWILNYSVSHCM
jgi:hypothetical protein